MESNKEHLEGGRSGGDRIYGVFDNQLPASLGKLPFDLHLSLQNVRKVVSDADGYQPHLIAPEQGYRRLIESSLNYFRGPAEASEDAVHFVLKELVRKSIGETQELKRFPTLQAEIAAAANEALERFRDESKKIVIRLVDMESSYITSCIQSRGRRRNWWFQVGSLVLGSLESGVVDALIQESKHRVEG